MPRHLVPLVSAATEFNLIFFWKTPQNCYQLKRLIKQPPFIHSLSTILFDSKEVRETSLMHLSQVYKGYINLALTLKRPRGQTGPFYAQRHVWATYSFFMSKMLLSKINLFFKYTFWIGWISWCCWLFTLRYAAWVPLNMNTCVVFWSSMSGMSRFFIFSLT
jgi:hypothetical protein